MHPEHSDTDTVDVLVVGSGAAGMTAAITAAHQGLSVLVVEKATHWGGSTARSGGGVWIPGNTVLRREAPDDDLEAARTYLTDIIGPAVDKDKIDAYIDHGPQVFDFLTAHSPLRMRWVPGYSDYYPEAEGGRSHGRSIEPSPSTPECLVRSWPPSNPITPRPPAISCSPRPTSVRSTSGCAIPVRPGTRSESPPAGSPLASEAVTYSLAARR